MADDAGALLVRSGLVASNALDDARARVASVGGTLGEQLVVGGAITDEALTEFFRSRLLVPQVNPNMLARLTSKVVATIPGDMAVELRAIPVSLDGDNNLTVAMSDPSDRHAVDEIAFFTGAYIVRAVATQMQIAWCLAHYYGHVTALGQRLLHTSSSPDSPAKAAAAAAASTPRIPRTKGLTGKVNAARHRAIAPITGPVNVIRPNSGELDLRPLAAAVDAKPAAEPRASTPRPATGSPPPERARAASPPPEAARARAASPHPSPAAPAARSHPATPPSSAPSAQAAPPATSPRSHPATPPSSAPSAQAASPRSHPATPPSAASPSHPLPAASSPAMPVASARSQPTPPPPARALPATPSPAASSPLPVAPRPATGSPSPDAEAILRPRSTAVGVPPAPGATLAPQAPRTADPPRAVESSGVISPPRATAVASPPPVTASSRSLPSSTPPADPRTLVPKAAPDAITLPPVNNDADASDAAPDRPRARSVSGEIRVPSRRAPSIRPPLPVEPDDDDDEPLIMIEPGGDDATGPRKLAPPPAKEERKPISEEETGPRKPAPPRRRAVKSDPPELYARAGEVDLKGPTDRTIDDEPRIVIDEDAFAPETGRVDTRTLRDALPLEPLDELDTGAIIHDRASDHDSAPILLEQPRTMTDQIRAMAAATLATLRAEGHTDDDDDTGEVEIVVLETKKPKRTDRITQHGVAPAPGRSHRDTEASGVPAMVEADHTHRTEHDDPTTIDLRAAPPSEDTSDQLAAPPAPSRDDDTNPHLLAPPPAPSRSAATIVVDDDDDPPSPAPSRTLTPGMLAPFALEHDDLDDGWGPPGTTIPPPLLGAVPGSDDDDDYQPSVIPMPNVDSSPLLVGPATGAPGGRTLVRALEDATSRAIDVLRQLERTQSRDEVVAVMVAHLAEAHHRAGFFVTRPAPTKGATELSLFSMTPRPPVMPFATLRLDRPSTLQDVVGTRLPYRGPMHDDASRTFLVAVLGACPAEILLVPVAVRERVVGVLFGEHRHHHTFDDQLALAARAAGMALERILKSKRT